MKHHPPKAINSNAKPSTSTGKLSRSITNPKRKNSTIKGTETTMNGAFFIA